MMLNLVFVKMHILLITYIKDNLLLKHQLVSTLFLFFENWTTGTARLSKSLGEDRYT